MILTLQLGINWIKVLLVEAARQKITETLINLHGNAKVRICDSINTNWIYWTSYNV